MIEHIKKSFMVVFWFFYIEPYELFFADLFEDAYLFGKIILVICAILICIVWALLFPLCFIFMLGMKHD